MLVRDRNNHSNDAFKPLDFQPCTMFNLLSCKSIPQTQLLPRMKLVPESFHQMCGIKQAVPVPQAPISRTIPGLGSSNNI